MVHKVATKSTGHQSFKYPLGNARKKIATKLGFISVKNKAQKYFAKVKINHNRNMDSLKQRVLTVTESIKSGALKVKNTVRNTLRRIAVYGSAGAIVGGTAAAIITGVSICNPLIGIPLTIGVGIGATGVGFIGGAGIGATLPITKKAGRRIIGTELRKKDARIAELEFQLQEQKKMLAFSINNNANLKSAH